MSAGLEIAERQPAVVGTSNGNGSTRGDGFGVLKRGIDLLRRPELNKSIAFTETCPTCGGPLTQGECLRCLVSLGFLSDSEQPDKVENGRRLIPGPLKYDHFEVEVGADGFPIELGAGAMAITYRARDTVLNSVVALKVIDRRVAQNPGARSRFLREARAAAQIRHPNVARVTHYGEQDGECFYVMELVEGETLEAKVRREGAMPLALALEVIEQAARALAAAESCGVVHRDIKPSNIMLESDPGGCAPIVKVIDYGIAKILNQEAERGAEQTQTGFIGTPAFASPEQFAPSEHTKIDTRSDIYSLGVTFWYLLSARVPFVGRSLEEIRARQEKPVPVEQLKGLHVPTRCVALLKSMLAPDPKDRPQSARELLSAVHRCYSKFSAEARLRRRRFAVVAAVATLTLVAIALGAWMYQRAQSSAQIDQSIAVLPFENLSGDKENAYLAEGIQDEILTRLSKVGGLKVISRNSTQHYKNKPENLREIAKQLRVAHVLEGSVQKSAGTVRVNVQLIKVVDRSPLWADTLDRPSTDILSLESEVAITVADQLRARLTGEEAQAIAAKPTDDPQAYDTYLRGLAYTVKSNFEPANVVPAQQNLKEAVRLDPKFALAWSLLSSVDSAGYITDTLPRTTALRDEARIAAETALKLQPNLGEAVSAKAFYHYVFLKDYDTAVRYFEQAARLLPSDSRIPEALAFVERRRGLWEQSEAYFNRAERVDPRNVRIVGQHAVSYKALRRFPDALRKFDDVRNITPDDPKPIARQAGIFQAMGDLPRAAALLTPLYSKSGDDGTISTQAYQAILERRTASIIPRLKEVLSKPDSALGEDKGELRFLLGCAQEIAGDHAGAHESWMQARSELESSLKVQPENYGLIGNLALIEMKLGDNASAMALADRGLAVNPIEKDALDGGYSLEVFARVTAATGEHDRSIAALKKLLSIPYEGPLATHLPLTPALLKLDPMFDPLRNDPRFKALTESSAASAPL